MQHFDFTQCKFGDRFITRDGRIAVFVRPNEVNPTDLGLFITEDMKNQNKLQTTISGNSEWCTIKLPHDIVSKYPSADKETLRAIALRERDKTTFVEDDWFVTAFIQGFKYAQNYK